MVRVRHSVPLLLSVTIVVALGPSHLAAQAPAIDSRVRIRHACRPADPLGPARLPCRTAGNLVYLTPDTVGVQAEPGPATAIAVPSILQVEVSRGTRRLTGEGAMIGLAVGAVGTLLIARYQEGDPFGGKQLAMLALPPLGAVIGMFVGNGFTSDRWERVDWP